MIPKATPASTLSSREKAGENRRVRIKQGVKVLVQLPPSAESAFSSHSPTVIRMIGNLNDVLQFQSTALRLRSERQQVLAANIANADTPNYKAVDFDFAQALSAAVGSNAGAASAKGGPGLASTAPGHLGTVGMRNLPTLQYRTPSQSAVDGNSVEMDAERAQFADNAVRYEASLRFLNGQIRTLMSAITG